MKELQTEEMEGEMKEIAEMECYWPGRRGDVTGRRRRRRVIGGGDCSALSRREQQAPRGVLDLGNGSPPRGLPLGADHSSSTRLLARSQRSYQMRHAAGEPLHNRDTRDTSAVFPLMCSEYSRHSNPPHRTF